MITSQQSNRKSPAVVDPSRDRYPYCLVWSPLPLITWLLPFIGHTGICDSDGIIYDFAGPYTIGKVRMAFGSPTRYLMLDPSKVREDWDSSVQQGNDIYSQRMHNICCDNCHSHVACCLNQMGYDGTRDYGMITIGVWMFFFGNFVSVGSFVRTYLPFAIIVLLIALFRGGIF